MDSKKRRTSRLVLVTTLFLGIITSGVNPAAAARASFSIKSYFSGSLETTYKYGSRDCMNIPVSYKASNSLGYPDHILFLEIRKKPLTGDESNGGFASLELGFGGDFQGSDPYQGKINIRVCRDSDLEFDENGDSLPPTKPGTYYFKVLLQQLRPPVALESKSIKITISK